MIRWVANGLESLESANCQPYWRCLSPREGWSSCARFFIVLGRAPLVEEDLVRLL